MKAVGAESNAEFVAPGRPSAPGQPPAPGQPVAIRDAATVLLVSDRPDLHVLMLERTHRAVFGPGATVFPGGAVDPADSAGALAEHITGLDDAAASAAQGIVRGGLAYRAAAVRECFEEAGILLAIDAAAGLPAEHDDGLAAARRELNTGGLAF